MESDFSPSYMALVSTTLELRPIIALGDDEIEFGLTFAQRSRRLIVRRSIAGLRGLVAREFEHDGARAHAALHHLAPPAAHEKTPAEFADRRHVGGHVTFVALRLCHVDVGDPIAFACRR